MVETKPHRIQRKRTKGWTMPENAVYVGRPGKYGNMFGLSTVMNEQRINDMSGVETSAAKGWRKRCVEMYREELLGRQMINPEAFKAWIAPLRGKDLACWCPIGEYCHADVLIELANK